MKGSSSPKHFHHGLYEVHLPATDVDRAIDFYVGKLGFALAFGARSGSSALLMYTDGHAQWMPAAAVFFNDPDGHLLELIAELSDPPRRIPCTGR